MTSGGRRNLTLSPKNVQDGQTTSEFETAGVGGKADGKQTPPATRINEHLESILGSINSAMSGSQDKSVVAKNETSRHVFDASAGFKSEAAHQTAAPSVNPYMHAEHDQLFQANDLRFEDTFENDRRALDISHPQNLTDKQFQEEIVNRMAQLEQVVGHNFSDLTSVAADAAQEATRMSMKDLDKTALGQRLGQIEQAFQAHLLRQAEKDAQTTMALQRLNEVAAMLNIPVGDKKAASEKAGHADRGKRNDKQSPTLDGANALNTKAANTKVGGAPLCAAPQRPAAQEAEDPLLSRSAALRSQLTTPPSAESEFDDDLVTMKRKGARPAVIVLVLALLLASLGLKLRDNPQFLNDIVSMVTGSAEKTSSSKIAKEGDAALRLNGKPPEKQTELSDLHLRGVRDAKSDDGLVSGNINRRNSKDVLSTANKEKNKLVRGEVKDSKLASHDRIERPETLLPSDNGKLAIPPALVGPYSLRHAAANGDASAQYEVGRRFAMGIGVKRDYDRAVKWYMHSAAQAFAPAQYRLATLYERGLGVQKSSERAKIWYKRSAELGNVKSMHNLAVLYASQNQTQPDYLNAIYWFKEAARRNLSDSQFNLAVLYQSGVGVKKNLGEAYKWFSLAARVGDVEAARRRDRVEKQLSRQEIVIANSTLQGWKPVPLKVAANEARAGAGYMTSTLSHARETVARSQVLTAQILLRKLGYKLDDVDGELTEETAQAIRTFEKNKGLPVTGKVTKDLLKVLNKAAI